MSQYFLKPFRSFEGDINFKIEIMQIMQQKPISKM